VTIKCRFCGGVNCDNGDHCGDCGCPVCGFPGALHEVRGFCGDCDWEVVPGAAKNWRKLHPPDGQALERLRKLFGLPADIVGAPLTPSEIAQAKAQAQETE